jgi:hypothetical protein
MMDLMEASTASTKGYLLELPGAAAAPAMIHFTGLTVPTRNTPSRTCRASSTQSGEIKWYSMSCKTLLHFSPVIFVDLSNAIEVASNIMTFGDSAVLNAGTYACAAVDGTTPCLDSYNMLMSENLHGTIMCTKDDAACVLDAAQTRRIMDVKGTGYSTLTYRSLVFSKGFSSGGGALLLHDGAGEYH